MKYIIHILILLVLGATSAFSQITFQAKVSKNKLGVNERLRIDFEMNKDGDDFTPPKFSNFTVIGGPNQSISNSWINGVRSYKKTYSYFLEPEKRGVFTISQASITIDDEVYKTTPIQITVTGAIEKPKDPNDPSYIASKNIHLVAQVSKTNVYLNEPISLEYRLYVSDKVAVDNWNEMDVPKYSDFWNQNIKIKEYKVEKGKYNGENYRYIVLRKTVLYPQKTGQLDLDPLTLDLTMRVPTNRRDFFGSLFMKSVKKRVSAGKKVITVKPLPEAGKPSDFSGAVGNFSFSVTPSKTELDATESLQLKVKVSGKGNLKLFKLPKLALPSALEVYEPEHNQKVSTNSSGMQGYISDIYTVVPQYKGKYPIPTVSFSYFDPKTESYKTLSSKDVVINVLNGPVSVAQNENTGQVNKQPVVGTESTFAFIKTKANFKPIGQPHFFKSNLFWSLFLLPFLAIPIAIIYKKKIAKQKADVYGNRLRKADKLAKKYLGNAKKSLDDKAHFYIALEKAWYNYFKAKLHIETTDFNKTTLAQMLKQKDVEDTVISDFKAILERCELARYTPTDSHTMKEDYDKSVKVMGLIDKKVN